MREAIRSAVRGRAAVSEGSERQTQAGNERERGSEGPPGGDYLLEESAEQAEVVVVEAREALERVGEGEVLGVGGDADDSALRRAAAA